MSADQFLNSCFAASWLAGAFCTLFGIGIGMLMLWALQEWTKKRPPGSS